MNRPLLLLACLLAAPALRGADRPNIVLILADDLGYGDLGAYGNQVNRTPQLDRLAREGLRFTDFHTNGANCSPTRAALLTGLYPQRCGVEEPLGEGARGLRGDTLTIAERLKAAGYATGLVGKWHLGYHPANGPTRHGFDEFVGHLHGATDYLSHVDRYGRMDWWHGEEPRPEEGHNTDLITRHSLRFIEKHQHEPFFLFISHSAIHFPWMTAEDKPQRLPGQRNDDKRAKLGPHAEGPLQPIVQRMIEDLDASVGAVIATLARLKLAERTLVFFTSDNGGIVDMAGVPIRPENRISVNAPFRGQKHGLYEGGHRVPAIAWRPGAIPAGRVSDELSITMDLAPTICELAGLDPQPSDGVSLARHLVEGRPLPERTLFWRNGQSKAVRWKQWKLVRIHDRPFELYDLSADREERPKLDQIGRRADLRDDLLTRLARWEQSLKPKPE